MRWHTHSSSRTAQLVGYFGLVAHTLLLVPGSARGLVAPLWAILVRAGVWVALLVVAGATVTLAPKAERLVYTAGPFPASTTQATDGSERVFGFNIAAGPTTGKVV